MFEKYWIGFSSIESIDSAFVLRLYNYTGDIEKAFNISRDEITNIDGLSVKKAENFLRARDKVDLEKSFDLVKNRGIKFLTFEDEKYPKLLKNIIDPPAVLYYKGDLSLCNFDRTLAVVGSRKATYNGKEALKYVISQLQNTDICIVSGLASGIDSCAHTSAIENNLKTIGVIASGFDFVYPSGNKGLYEKIENGFGAIFTEYYPTFEPLKFRFPQRNRIVTGLSYGTLVVEASLKSGALISANLTLEQGRELMCIPGLITNPNTQGIYKLIKNGATIVTTSDDILEALNWEIQRGQAVQLKLDDLDDNELKIFETISLEDKNVDEISNNTGLDVSDILSYLTIMELKGIIEKVEGDRYKKVNI
ncbi:MAG: DNA-processing protein DprA [Clostridiaceae bacterium]|jgi:DNA processing protein|nr:DNA-processing protein DprA [Clostridiaceae bacterium]